MEALDIIIHVIIPLLSVIIAGIFGIMGIGVWIGVRLGRIGKAVEHHERKIKEIQENEEVLKRGCPLLKK